MMKFSNTEDHVEALCQLIERDWYTARGEVEAALARASGHDLTAVYKRLLRALPQPPLTQELMRLFYHTYALSCSAQARALNLLVLLLPGEHNVAMIIAPALFPPSLPIKPTDSLETQLATAANSCHVTEALMRWSDSLWVVPASLLAAAQRKPRARHAHT